MRFLISFALLIALAGPAAAADHSPSAVSIYGGQMTANHFEELLLADGVATQNSWLLALALAQRLGGWHDKLSYGLEGQLVKHFKMQDHWEFNLLGTLRWESFIWDNWRDTSVAFGLGGSWATKHPEVEINNNDSTTNLLVYWMLELAVVPFPSRPQWELIARIHHRSDAFGLMAEDGGSNALGVGWRYSF